MTELLKQPPYAPIPVEKQTVIIYAGTKGYLDDIPVSEINRFEQEFYTFLDAKYSNILESIRETKELKSETEEELKKAIEDFKSQFAA